MATAGDIPTRTERIAYQVSEVALQLVNEPSLGLYRINEHVSTAVPKIRDCDKKLGSALNKMNGCVFDIDYDSEAIKSLEKVTQFESISSEIQRAIVLQKKLNDRKETKIASKQGAKSSASKEDGSTWPTTEGNLTIN
jgi:hypothetical protein